MIPIVPKHKMAWRIRVTFAGKLPPKEYMTPNIWHNDPGWGSETFNRQIEKLEFFLPNGNLLVMSGMEKYNFFVEAFQSKRTRGNAEINAFCFCGKIPGQDTVEVWRVGSGIAIREQKPWGKEWGGGPTKGWKTGVSGDPVSMIRVKGKNGLVS